MRYSTSLLLSLLRCLMWQTLPHQSETIRHCIIKFIIYIYIFFKYIYIYFLKSHKLKLLWHKRCLWRNSLGNQKLKCSLSSTDLNCNQPAQRMHTYTAVRPRMMMHMQINPQGVSYQQPPSPLQDWDSTAQKGSLPVQQRIFSRAHRCA